MYVDTVIDFAKFTTYYIHIHTHIHTYIVHTYIHTYYVRPENKELEGQPFQGNFRRAAKGTKAITC